MKNYLVSAVRPIENTWCNAAARDLYLDYQEMYRMSVASFQHFAVDDFEPICWTEPARDNEDRARKNWQEIHNLWHREPCNIFWHGADTLLTRPLQVFSDHWQHYRLFNYTDPPTCPGVEHYFNDDVQYYPHTMKSEVWDLGERMWQGVEFAPDRNWGFDQRRHNMMFWSQPIEESDRKWPAMNFMAHFLRDERTISAAEEFNGIPLSEAIIIHFCASRQPRDVIRVMKDMCKELGIQHE